LFITVLGFVAGHWRRGDLDLLHEWGLAGRRFGSARRDPRPSAGDRV
jgi:SSS family solute:Na+ symporter